MGDSQALAAMQTFENPLAEGFNLTVTGFMGTGKSTVASILAERLGRQLVDMDERIEAEFGKTIAQVFAEDGEEIFRQAEARLCHTLARESGLVIATGGGTLVSDENWQVLEGCGPVVCLTAGADTVLERVETFEDRPLLPGDREEKKRNIESLLLSRRHAYGRIPLRVPTDGVTPDTVVERVLDTLAGNHEIAEMNRITVPTPEGHYHICIGEGILAQAGRLLSNRAVAKGQAAIVTNADIGALYADIVSESLQQEGYTPLVCLVPEGEAHKTLATIQSLYDQFVTAGLDRSSPIVGLGGGVIGDMAGFAAATYLRGAPFVQIPTSLLSMVDASVGGKTGVDLPQGKNLVGAFKQPAVVIIDPEVLAELPAEEFRSGLAEIVKHGILGAPDLFRQMEEEGPTNLTQMISDAVRVKVDVVIEDPFERGRRATLNLGHTFGHAIEQVSGYRLRHGEAVAVGTVAAARMAVALGRCDAETANRIESCLDRLGLPISATGLDLDEVYAMMFQDKKRRGKTLRFIIPQAIGDVIIIDDPGEQFVRAALASVLVEKD
ncbi:MAG: 3-dehydroquinate synthase [Caldilineaceae bacterium]|nr:3-dehydroquinate synthase [Caldilineaceae bacterium]